MRRSPDDECPVSPSEDNGQIAQWNSAEDPHCLVFLSLNGPSDRKRCGRTTHKETLHLPLHSLASWGVPLAHGRSVKKGLQRSHSLPSVLCLHWHANRPSSPDTHWEPCPLHLHRPPTDRSLTEYWYCSSTSSDGPLLFLHVTPFPSAANKSLPPDCGGLLGLVLPSLPCFFFLIGCIR